MLIFYLFIEILEEITLRKVFYFKNIELIKKPIQTMSICINVSL